MTVTSFHVTPDLLADLVVVEMKTKTPNLFVAAQGCRTSVT